MVVNVGLGNTQFYLHPQFHWQTMGVPSCLAVNLVSLHRLVSVESVLNGACKHMVNSRMSVSRGRPLEEYELWTSFTFIYSLVEHVVSVPLLKYVFIHLSQIQAIVFGKFLSHNYSYRSMLFIPLIIRHLVVTCVL